MRSGAAWLAIADSSTLRAAFSSLSSRLAAILAVMALLGIGSLGLTSATGRDAAATSRNPFADLGLPEVAVTITNEAFEGAPTMLTAGRYVLSVTNDFQQSTEESEGAALLQLPDDVSAPAFIASVRDEDSDWPADWYYGTTLAGGAYATPGTTAYAVIDLHAGEWVLWSEVPGAPQAPVPITVTGESPRNVPAPIADATVEMTDFDFAFSTPLQAGPHVVEVVNSGSQPHFMFIGGVPDGTTVAEAQAAFDAYWNPESASPAPFSFAETPELLGTGDQSAGTTAWYAVDLPAGTAVFTCFTTDPESGLSHDMLGMTEVVEIE